MSFCFFIDFVGFFQVNPLTMKCRGNGTQILREYFNDPEPDVKDLIDKGLLIKIDSRKVPKTKRQRMGKISFFIFHLGLILKKKFKLGLVSVQTSEPF